MASQQPGSATHAYKQGDSLAKRRRIALACSACRVRKSRCDGRRPSCSTCASLTLECQYEPSDSSTNVLVRKDYVSNLEQRLKDVERALQRHDDLLTGHLSACCKTTEEGSAGASGRHLSFNTVTQVQEGVQLDTANVEDPGTDEARTDGLAIVFDDEQTTEFYGETSNTAFTRCILQAIAAISKDKQHETTALCKESGCAQCNWVPASQQPSPSAIETPRHSRLSPSTLPPAEEMDTFLKAYFSAYGSLFPFLHEPTFRATYDECKANGFTTVHRTWLGLLNMTFAMASNVDQSAEVSAKERFRKSYVFFVRAVSLCSESSMRSVSLEIVQYLLLAVLYLQGTQKSIQTWNVHGILVRTAIALGLHSDQSGQGLDPIQQEVRRRTWLSIYCLDKLLSVTFGRPPSIPDEYIDVVQLPSPWPATTSTDVSRRQPNGVDINTEFLSASVRLYRIVGRSVARQYGMNLGHVDPDMDESTAIQAANAMRQELRRWASSLPPHMSLCEPGSDVLLINTELNRLRVILTLRHDFASILIHRPLLCATLRHLTMKEASVGSILPYRIQLALAEAHECIRSAENTIEIVHAVLSAQKADSSNLGIWFFTLFYVFTSSLVLLGRSVLAQHGVYADDDSSSSPVHSFLTKALEALDKLDRDNRLVYNCAKFIRQLFERQRGHGHFAAAEQHDARYRPNLSAESDSSAYSYEQAFPFFPGSDLDMTQFSMPELFNPSYEAFGLNIIE